MANYKKSENTREIILKTASHLFYQKGYNKTTIREIAKESGLSLSRLNYHFNSKADLATHIFEQFLYNFRNTIESLNLPTTDRLLREVIHIRLIEKFFLSENKTMDFYYELARDDLMRAMLIESDYRHFVRQSKFLHQPRDRQTLRMYAHVFINTMIGLFCAKREGDLTASTDTILDMCNDVHLKLWEINASERQAMIAAAHDYTQQITFKTDDLFTTYLVYTYADKTP